MPTTYQWGGSYDYMKANPIVTYQSVTQFVGEPIDTAVSANTYGKTVPISIGNRKIVGNVIWAKPLTQSITQWLSGTETTYNDILNDFVIYQAFVPGVQVTNTYSAAYSYSATFAVSFGFGLDDRPTILRRLWANARLIYDGGPLPTWLRFYPGTETQTPDAAIIADKGAEALSYRPHIYVVIEGISLVPYANAIPTITAELVTAGDSYDFLLEKYSWVAANGTDLDTRTYLTGVDASVDDIYLGWDRFSSIGPGGTAYNVLGDTPSATNYLQWFGDDTTANGGEHVLVNIKKIREDFPASGTFSLNLRAFWYRFVEDGDFQVTRTYYKGAYDFADVSGSFLVSTGLTPLKTTVNTYNVQTNVSSDIVGDFIDSFTILTDDAISGDRYPLADFIVGVAGLCGFLPGQVSCDASVDDLIDAGIIDSDFNFNDFAAQIAGAFGLERIETINGIRFLREPPGTITVDRVLTEEDILDVNTVAIDTQRAPDSTIPNIVEIKYLDANLDYTYANQLAHRPQFPVRTTQSNTVQSWTVPVVITAGEAAGLAANRLYEAWNDRLTHVIRLPSSQIDLEPSDIISFPLRGKTYVAKLTEGSLGADLSLQIQARTVRQFVDLDLGSDGTGSTPPLSLRVKESRVAVIDSTLAFVDDDSPFYDIYLAPSPAVAGLAWPGAQIHYSIDGGTVYRPLSPIITAPAITGDTTTALGTVTDPWVTDTVNTVSLTLRCGDFSTLLAATSAQLDAGANLAALGAPGRWEFIQYGTVSLNAGGTVTLSNLRRGRRGTESFVGTHAIGDTLVLMTGVGIYKASLNASYLTGFSFGGTLWFKAVGIGEDVASAVPVSMVVAGNAEKPFAPVNLNAVIAGSDIALSWTRRDRLDTGLVDGSGTVPLSDSPEAYEIDIMDGATVKRTLTSSTPSKTYTAANIATDFGSMPASLKFRVYQISGFASGNIRGFRAESTITL